jgi:hypothetical protein
MAEASPELAGCCADALSTLCQNNADCADVNEVWRTLLQQATTSATLLDTLTAFALCCRSITDPAVAVAAVPDDLLDVHVATTASPCDETGFVQLLAASQNLMRARMNPSYSGMHDTCKEQRNDALEDLTDALRATQQLAQSPMESKVAGTCHEQQRLVLEHLQIAASLDLAQICVANDQSAGLKSGKHRSACGAEGMTLLAKAALALEEAVQKGRLDEQRLSVANAVLQLLQELL